MYWNQYPCTGLQKQPFWKQQFRSGICSKTGIHWHLPLLHINNNENRLRQSIISAGKSKSLTMCCKRLICLRVWNGIFERNLIINAYYFKFNPDTEPPSTVLWWFSQPPEVPFVFFCINPRTRLSWHYKIKVGDLDEDVSHVESCSSQLSTHTAAAMNPRKADSKRNDTWPTTKLQLSGKRRGWLKCAFFRKIIWLILLPTFLILLK